MKKIEFLNPKNKLVEEVVAKLCGDDRVRLVNGAHSLSHVMVVVPTAQSGRNLRLLLARKSAEKGWGGILPPKVVLPFQLVLPADQSLREANEAEAAAYFMQFLKDKKDIALTTWPHLFQREGMTAELQAVLDADAGFALLDQMSDIWHILSGKGLLMQDVTKDESARLVLESAKGDEYVRWEELASFEACFFSFLNRHGLRHPTASVALAKNAAAPLDPTIEEVMLPALSDPILVLHDVLAQYADKVTITTLLHCEESQRAKFDEWGCPKVESWTGSQRPKIQGLVDADIFSLPNDSLLAMQLAKDFPTADSGLKLPTLGLCDSGLFTAISSAILVNGHTIQNPERNRLAVSSLGLLLRDLFAFWRPSEAGVPWTSFAALMRSNDVLNALKSDGFLVSRSRVLTGLDAYQNKCLPTFIKGKIEAPNVGPHDRDGDAIAAFITCGNGFLGWVEASRNGNSPVDFLRQMLGLIFSSKRLGGTHVDKEFEQAANCVRESLSMLSSEQIGELKLTDAQWVALAQRLFAEASYSLETDEENVIKTEGWLELVWSLGDKIVLAGLHEGAVPDSVVGHAFLPNELRVALGLTSNATRLARDSWLLQELIESHAQHDVHAYISRTTGQGDIRRPSRLLFLCDDTILTARVSGLFGEVGETTSTPSREIPLAWRLQLPDEVPIKKDKEGHEYLSPSAIDTYLKSPIEYLLKYGMGLGDRYEEKKELGFDDYGTFVHRVLQLFGEEQKGHQLTDERDIAAALKRIIDEEGKRFGDHPTMNIRLQLQSARERLMRFANIQAEWAQEGWHVEGTEISYFIKPFEGLDVWIKGFVDRVDYREATGGGREFRIIDYKTWDKYEGASGKHIKSGAGKQGDFACRLKLPTIIERNRPTRMLTVQLPLYGACLEAQYPGRFNGPITKYDYLVLAEDQVGVLGVEKYAELSLGTARAAIERIKANIFWPPRADKNTELYDLGRLFMLSPEQDLDDGWVGKQEAKLKELENA